MTLLEVSEKYHVSSSTLSVNFKRTQESILKRYGVKIVKIGRGKQAEYEEKIESDGRAVTMYDEPLDLVMMETDQLKLVNWEFLVMLGIITTPMRVFRGSYKDFLEYIGIDGRAANVEKLKLVLEAFHERDLIGYQVDKTEGSYFMASIYKKVEEKMEIDLGMMRNCKNMVEGTKKSWVPLLKTWLGIMMLVVKNGGGSVLVTYAEVAEVTGLSKYAIAEAYKTLAENRLFKISKAYRKLEDGEFRCLGTDVTPLANWGE